LRGVRFLLALAAVSTLGGCGGPASKQIAASVQNTFSAPSSCDNGSITNIFSAVPLCPTYPVGQNAAPLSASEADAAVNDPKASARFVGAALTDSITKCQNFIAIFTGAQSGENTFLDVASLALSGLATVFVPANTVRALSAASTITQGTKAAINSDLFQQVTIQLFVQQINGTYFKEYRDYTTALSSSAQGFSASTEFPKIQLMHKDCSLVFAAANISSAEAEQSGTSKPIAASDLTDGAQFKTGSGVIYTVKVTSSGKPPNVTTRYTFTTQSPGVPATPAVQAEPNKLVDMLNSVNAAKM